MSEHTALVTGAASGIGAACVREFTEHGWQVIGWDAAVSADTHAGGAAWATVDVSDWDAVGELAKDLPPLSAVINCAGISSRQPATSLTREEWDRVMAVNLSGVFYVARWCFSALTTGQGVLVNIASITAGSGFRDRVPYSVTKSGVVTLSRQLGIDWASAGVRVLAVSPGFTATAMLTEGIEAGLTREADILGHTPQRRLLAPAEIAAAIRRLVGPEFAAMTGSEVLLDGGFNALTGF